MRTPGASRHTEEAEEGEGFRTKGWPVDLTALNAKYDRQNMPDDFGNVEATPAPDVDSFCSQGGWQRPELMRGEGIQTTRADDSF